MSLSIKATRLLLALSVSLWMAGGCLFGCSNVMGAQISQSVHEPAALQVTGDSCHSVQSHDCCTRPKSSGARRTLPKAAPSHSTPKEVLASVPRGMKDCPLMVNSTAVTSKNNANVADHGRAPVAVLPKIENRGEEPDFIIGSSYLPNRGPTHLRCCVFLI